LYSELADISDEDEKTEVLHLKCYYLLLIYHIQVIEKYRDFTHRKRSTVAPTKLVLPPSKKGKRAERQEDDVCTFNFFCYKFF
jgi:hypothetical protein